MLRHWMRGLRLAELLIRRAVAPIVTRTVDGDRMTFSVRDQHIGTSLFLDRCWEVHLVSLLPQYGLAGGIAIDVGANVGIYTNALRKLVGAEGRVIAFEPDPVLFRMLVRNATAPNVVLLQTAASDHECVVRLVRDPSNHGNTRIVESGGDFESPAVTIDSITRDLAEGSVRFIKIDVQGHERAVLEGMRQTLERNPAVIVQVELSAGAGAPDVVRLIRALGWQGYEVLAGRFLPMQPPEHYAWPLFRDGTDFVLAADGERMRTLLFASCVS